MATKGSQNAFSKLKAWAGKEDKDVYTTTREDQQVLSGNRKSAAQLIAKLNAINFLDPANKLSQEIIKQEDYEGICRFAVNELRSPIEITRDVSGLDKYLEQAVDALEASVKEGLPTAARWAAAALYQGLTNLRQEVSALDKPYEETLYQQRLDYAANLEIIIKESLELDRRSQALAKDQLRFQKQLDELLEKRTSIEKKRKTPEGLSAVAEIRQYASNPLKMSPTAKSFRQELEDYHMLLSTNKETEIGIYIAETKVASILQTIASTKNVLSQVPVASDPMLQEKITRAMDIYRKGLLETLNGIAESRKMHENFLSQMEMLGQHEVFQDSASKAIQAIDMLDLEHRKEVASQRQQYELMKKEKERKLQEKTLLDLLRKETESAYQGFSELEEQPEQEENTEQEEDSDEDLLLNEMDPE